MILSKKKAAATPITPERLASPYQKMDRSQWAKLRADQPMTLSQDEITKLQSLNDRLSMDEVIEIYLPLSRLLSLYVEAKQGLFQATQTFLGTQNGKVPYVIGVAGSVAVGKSTTSRVLQALLGRWPGNPKVALVTTDGFLLPNSVLEKQGLMDRKGFPESYDVQSLLAFLQDIKAGCQHIKAPLYSHLTYDVVPDQFLEFESPDIVIIEGLNVLQSRRAKDEHSVPFVSDYFDFSIYIDADEEILEQWYVERFLRLRQTAFSNPRSYFHRYANLTDFEARLEATAIWRQINLINLQDNIRPTLPRADLIFTKGADHHMQHVAFRKI